MPTSGQGKTKGHSVNLGETRGF